MPEVEEPIVIDAPPWYRRHKARYYPGAPEIDTVKFQHGPKGRKFWESNPGPQTWALHCPYDEILTGGSRGGGKSACLIAWMAMGDPSLPPDDPAHTSFLNDPSFRGLFLRHQYQDLAEFIEEAREFFRPFGVEVVDDPAIFVFPGPKGKKSGAKIYTNHLGSEEAFNKYRGWNITKIGIEELTQIPTQSRYLRLLGSLRSVERNHHHTLPDGRVETIRRSPLRTQIMSTTNPDGPGSQWVKKRFVEVRLTTGNIADWNTPMLDPITKLWRIFIPMRLKENPYLRDNRTYMGNLLSQDDVIRRQWIDGDWNAAAGTFFRDYRPYGPRGQQESDDYPWAKHLVEPVELKPWWYRWGSGDWGYDHPAAFHKFCRNENDNRIHVYDEFQVRRIGSSDLGKLVAEWWMPDLEKLPDHQITLYFSPEAFNKEDASRSIAEQFADGVKSVLGPFGAILMRYSQDEKQVAARDPKMADLMFQQRQKDTIGQLCIQIRQASRDRKARMTYLRDLLKFRPSTIKVELDPDHLKHIYETQGLLAYEKELSSIQDMKPEILPKIVFWKICRELDRCLQMAVHDDPPKSEEVRKFDAEDGVGGDDALDSLSHGAYAYKEIETVIPKSYWLGEQMREAERHYSDPTILMQIQRFQEAKYDKVHGQKLMSGTIPRAGSQRHWTQ